MTITFASDTYPIDDYEENDTVSNGEAAQFAQVGPFRICHLPRQRSPRHHRRHHPCWQ